MKRSFTALEKRWLTMLLAPAFPDKAIIEKQLEMGYVIDMDVRSSWASVGLGTDCTERFTHDDNVPIIMDAHQDDGTIIGFKIMLHKGYICELAIYHIAGYAIPDYEKILLNNVTYDILI
ncbi:TPA: hypothetical protein TY768_000627 [Streptococcus suis]|nr:hypothetical protein [Streptococcus suis]